MAKSKNNYDMTKYQMLRAIEQHKSSKPWTNQSLATLFENTMTKKEVIEWYNEVMKK